MNEHPEPSTPGRTIIHSHLNATFTRAIIAWLQKYKVSALYYHAITSKSYRFRWQASESESALHQGKRVVDMKHKVDTLLFSVVIQLNGGRGRE